MSSQTDRFLLPAACAATLIGFSGPYTSPYLVGVGVETLGLSAAESGWLAFSVVAAVAAGSATAPLISGRSDIRRILPPLTLLTIVIQCLSMWPLPTPAFVVLQVLANFASGMVSGAMSGRLGRSPQAERNFSLMFASASAGFAILLFALPLIQEKFGGRALFASIATVQLLCLPVIFLVGRGPAAQRPQATPPGEGRFVLSLIAPLFGAMTITFLTYGGVYSFSERVAVELRMGPETIGTMLALSTILAIAGATIAGRFAPSLGRTLPLCGSIVVLGLSYVAILGGRSQSSLFAGMILYGFVSLVFTSYAYATAAAIDSSGRLVSILQGYVLLPYALGPAVMGLALSYADYHSLAVPVLGLNVLAALIVAPVVLRLGRKAKPPQPVTVP